MGSLQISAEKHPSLGSHCRVGSESERAACVGYDVQANRSNSSSYGIGRKNRMSEQNMEVAEDLFCKVPPRGTQAYKLLMAMQDGVRLTVKVALEKYGVYALSQRCGDLRRKYGWPIKSRTVEVRPRTFVSEYWL